MKIVRLSSGGADRERQDAFRSEMNDTILALDSTFHLNKAFMQHNHRIEAVNVRHHNNVGMARLILQGQKNEAFRGSGPLASNHRATSNSGLIVGKFL